MMFGRMNTQYDLRWLNMSYKRILSSLLLGILVFSLSGCFVSVDSYAFDISDIQRIDVIEINIDDRESDTVLISFENLTEEDQLTQDIYTLLESHTYITMADYQRQRRYVSVNSLYPKIVVITTIDHTYTMGLARMAYPHLDHDDYEEKAVILSDELEPLQVMGNPLFTDLLELLDIAFD